MKFPSGSGTTPNTSKSPTLSQLTFQNIREAIYRQTGIYYTDNKKNQLEQTIAKRLLRLNLASFEKYLELIESPAQKSLKSKEIFNAMAVQDSSFFSSQEQISVVKDIVIPDILKKKQNNNLKLKKHCFYILLYFLKYLKLTVNIRNIYICIYWKYKMLSNLRK